MSPIDSYPLRSGKKSSEEKKRKMEKKKPPPCDESATPSSESTTRSMSEMLRQFRLINDRASCFETIISASFNQFGTKIKDDVVGNKLVDKIKQN